MYICTRCVERAFIHICIIVLGHSHCIDLFPDVVLPEQEKVGWRIFERPVLVLRTNPFLKREEEHDDVPDACTCLHIDLYMLLLYSTLSYSFVYT